MALGVQKYGNGRIKKTKTISTFQVPGGQITLKPGSLIAWVVFESALDNNVLVTTQNGTVEFFNDTVLAGVPYENAKGWMVGADTTLDVVCTENLTVTIYTF